MAIGNVFVQEAFPFAIGFFVHDDLEVGGRGLLVGESVIADFECRVEGFAGVEGRVGEDAGTRGGHGDEVSERPYGNFLV